jgi:hypothetical protein
MFLLECNDSLLFFGGIVLLKGSKNSILVGGTARIGESPRHSGLVYL